MLVLSRRLNEKLLIPCIGTAVQVLSIHGGQVRLGVDAPPEVAVFREEIYDGEALSKRPAAATERPSGMLRNRLAALALGLDRLHAQTQGQLSPGAEAALHQLGDAFDELARVLNTVLDAAAREAKRPAGCAR